MPIFKPLSFIVFRDAQLLHSLSKSKYFSGHPFDALDYSGYAKWLCGEGENGLLNLINVFLFLCELRGPPSLPVLVPGQ
jgi:hypothetical protein